MQARLEPQPFNPDRYADPAPHDCPLREHAEFIGHKLGKSSHCIMTVIIEHG